MSAEMEAAMPTAVKVLTTILQQHSGMHPPSLLGSASAIICYSYSHATKMHIPAAEDARIGSLSQIRGA